MNKLNFSEVLSESEISEIERTNSNSYKFQSCNDFCVIPNDEKKTVAIVPKINGAFLELSEEKAKVLISIIQDCVQLW